MERFKKAYLVFEYNIKLSLCFNSIFILTGWTEKENNNREVAYMKEITLRTSKWCLPIGQPRRLKPPPTSHQCTQRRRWTCVDVWRSQGLWNPFNGHCTASLHIPTREWLPDHLIIFQRMTFFSGFHFNHPSPFPVGSPSDPSNPELTHSKVKMVSVASSLLYHRFFVSSPVIFPNLQTALFNWDPRLYLKQKELSCREIASRNIGRWLYISLRF